MRALVLAVLIALLVATPAEAVPPVEVVHTENVRVGPYAMEVSFSDWPIRAERSLDFVFRPADGIAAHDGRLRIVSPDGTGREARLARHPRARDMWGLDIRALPDEGRWRLEFAVSGPRGEGRGGLDVAVGPRPGPPALLSWTVGLGPALLGGLAVLVLWWRGRRTSRVDVWTWD
ncbi:hypothetical protein FHS29_004573 [Saccharothrix tamanrassetensis]|uniref:CopC domain-containing protein n=1 Tax=Saccharothrix tamanrassetensis TaxID=1051531 RepID=A0A841CPP1_9PSEU|nr:hypothetical protein [Saccharothrix tamanrassetensis]MBB5957965.1 hypothetical protein [Saccharothrix tamanrassetensis]